jgi:hypothetical protein
MRVRNAAQAHGGSQVGRLLRLAIRLIASTATVNLKRQCVL